MVCQDLMGRPRPDLDDGWDDYAAQAKRVAMMTNPSTQWLTALYDQFLAGTSPSEAVAALNAL